MPDKGTVIGRQPDKHGIFRRKVAEAAEKSESGRRFASIFSAISAALRLDFWAAALPGCEIS